MSPNNVGINDVGFLVVMVGNLKTMTKEKSTSLSTSLGDKT